MAEHSQRDDVVLIVFRVGPDLYTVDVSAVQEVLPAAPTTRVPGAPVFVEGVLELRGLVVPVVDLRRRLGYDGKVEGRSARFIVVAVGDRVIAMAVDEVLEVVRVHANDLGPAPDLVRESGVKHVVGVVRGNEELTLVLDLESALSAREQAALEEFESIPHPDGERVKE